MRLTPSGQSSDCDISHIVSGDIGQREVESGGWEVNFADLYGAPKDAADLDLLCI